MLVMVNKNEASCLTVASIHARAYMNSYDQRTQNTHRASYIPRAYRFLFLLIHIVNAYMHGEILAFLSIQNELNIGSAFAIGLCEFKLR